MIEKKNNIYLIKLYNTKFITFRNLRNSTFKINFHISNKIK